MKHCITGLSLLAIVLGIMLILSSCVPVIATVGVTLSAVGATAAEYEGAAAMGLHGLEQVAGAAVRSYRNE